MLVCSSWMTSKLRSKLCCLLCATYSRSHSRGKKVTPGIMPRTTSMMPGTCQTAISYIASHVCCVVRTAMTVVVLVANVALSLLPSCNSMN
jgi:hypothetical protein